MTDGDRDGGNSAAQSRGWAALFPRCAGDRLASAFLDTLDVRGFSRNTVLAYGRAMESFIALQGRPLEEVELHTETVLAFLAHLHRTPSRHHRHQGRPLSASTIRQQMCGLRAFAEHLIARGILDRNPVSMGTIRRSPEGGTIPVRRGLVRVPRYVPRLPNEVQWQRMLTVLGQRSTRDRLMFALAYDGAFRRDELVTLRLDDFDFAARQVEVRPERSKNGYGRRVVYSVSSARLLADYLIERRYLTAGLKRGEPPFLFLSTSARNRGRPVSGFTWGLLASGLARECDVPGFTTHTLRHLRLTDLARCGLDIAEIARYAGHRNVGSTLIYIHLSGRDMARAFARASRPVVERLAGL